MPRSRRQRSVIVLLLTAFLLFQQLAMSALACAMPQVSAAAASVSMSIDSGMTADCQAMMAAGKPNHATDALCQKHCSPDATSASIPSIPPVPALALPPMLHALAVAPATHSCNDGTGEVFARSHPPPRLRYCSLLI